MDQFTELNEDQRTSLNNTISNRIIADITEGSPEIRSEDIWNEFDVLQTFEGSISLIKRLLSEIDSPMKGLKLFSEHNVEYDKAPLMTYALTSLMPGSVSNTSYFDVKKEREYTREMMPRVVAHYTDITKPGLVFAVLMTHQDTIVTFKTISNSHIESTRLAIAFFTELFNLRTILRRMGITDIMPLKISEAKVIESGGEKLVATPIEVLIRYKIKSIENLKKLLSVVCDISIQEPNVSEGLLPKIELTN